jgi:hypothetical protein
VKRLVQFELEDGTPVFLEIEDHEGRQRISRGEGAIEKAETRFADAIGRVKPAAEAVLNAFRELNTPQEIALEFGIKFNAQAGAIIASVDSEATFKVSLKWVSQDLRR